MSSGWSYGDRMGRLAPSKLRDLRMNILVSVANPLRQPQTADLERLANMAAILEAAIAEVDAVGNDGIVAEELPEAIRAMVREYDAEIRRLNDRVDDAGKEAKREIEAHADRADRAELTAREVGQTADEWRRRAELAEHQLGQASAQIAALEAALERARADRPLRRRQS